MTAPTPRIQDIVNDPNYVPIAASANGDILVTDDGTVIIVSSTLKIRYPAGQFHKRKWLVPPPFNVRKL